MAKRKQYRWVCPTCGVGRLGPKTYQADDARSVCLPCTQDQVKGAKGPAPFVLLTCPTLDKSAAKEAAAKEEGRKVRAEQIRVKSAQNRAARRQEAEARKELRALERAKFFRGEVDLRVETRRIAKAMKYDRTIVLGWVSTQHIWVSGGEGHGRNRVVKIQIAPDQSLNRSRVTIIGCIAGIQENGHGSKWRERVARTCNKLYGTKINGGLKPCVTKPTCAKGMVLKPSYHRLITEAIEQMRIQGLGPNEFLTELRDASLNKNNSARARLMIHLAPSDDIREVGKQYVSEHF